MKQLTTMNYSKDNEGRGKKKNGVIKEKRLKIKTDKKFLMK